MRRDFIVKTLITFGLLSALLAAMARPALPVHAQGGFNSDKAQRATVYVIQSYTNPAGQVVISCVGSGTLVSLDGLILTNAHNALSSDTCHADRLAVGLTVRPGEAPVATYYAQLVESNIGLDLAVIQITTTLDGKPVDRANLSLPFVELGDSDAAVLDETINVVGYASGETSGTVGQTVRGTINGFTAEARIGDRAWIKTSAVIPGSMSGGGAYGNDGRLIGIPTIEPARTTGSNSALNCRQVQDTNGDGRIDSNDACIPVSGFVNALRPSRLARGLILAAQLGLVSSSRSPTPGTSGGAPGSNPTIGRLFFAPGVNQAGMASSVVTAMPGGTSRLYLFFDYDNMRDGMIYELRTTIDGVPSPIFSLAPATWSGGKKGQWYIGSTAQTWPNGAYDFSLLVEGTRVASQQITIGGAAHKTPTFSDILFGVLDSDGSLVSTGNVLPVGQTINAEFVYNNLSAGQAWKQVWYYEGAKVSEVPATWKEGENGKLPINAASPNLQPGSYRLELYIADQMVATSDFILAGVQTDLKTNIFENVSFASDLKDNQPGGTIGGTFGSTIQSLYATFDWHAMGTGTPWTWRWSVDNNPLFELTEPWNAAATGKVDWVGLASPGHMPDGSYKIELLIAGVVMGSATAKVGLGQLPVTTFGVAEGVQLQGQITDAETGKGIPGVTFIVLKADPALDSKTFTWTMAQVYALSFTDSEGRFTLSKLLIPQSDNTYSILVLAQGYLPVLTDGVVISDTTKTPLTYNIELNRD